MATGHPDYLLYQPDTRQTAIWHLNNNVFISGIRANSSGWLDSVITLSWISASCPSYRHPSAMKVGDEPTVNRFLRQSNSPFLSSPHP